MRRKRDATTSHGRTGGACRTAPVRDRRGKARAWLGRAAAWRQPRRRETKPGDADCRWLAREGADGSAGPGRPGRRRRGERARKCKVGFDRGRADRTLFRRADLRRTRGEGQPHGCRAARGRANRPYQKPRTVAPNEAKPLHASKSTGNRRRQGYGGRVGERGLTALCCLPLCAEVGD